MRLNGFRCDVCCKEHLLDPTLILQSYREVLPAEWFMVSQGPYKKDKPWDQQEPLLFCSVQCLHDWAAKKLPLPPAEVERLANIVQVESVFDEAPRSSTEVFQGLAERLQQLGEVPRNRLMQSNWLPGDEE